MISLILAKKILSLFFVMALGIVLVRCGIVRSQDSKVLSMISLYLLSLIHISEPTRLQ